MMPTSLKGWVVAGAGLAAGVALANLVIGLAARAVR
jgi:hypothetical protein